MVDLKKIAELYNHKLEADKIIELLKREGDITVIDYCDILCESIRVVYDNPLHSDFSGITTELFEHGLFISAFSTTRRDGETWIWLDKIP